MSEQYLIEKNGWYYRPQSAGYTGLKCEAGRYSFEEAAMIVGPNGPDGSQDGLSMWAESDAPEFSGRCPLDVKLVERTKAELKAQHRAELEAVREACAKIVDDALNNQVCAKCGHTRKQHHFRHPFEATGFMDPVAAIRALDLDETLKEARK